MFLLVAGCSIRVTAEVPAYQGLLGSAWSWLPVSAVTEMCGVIAFAVNVVLSLLAEPRPT